MFEYLRYIRYALFELRLISFADVNNFSISRNFKTYLVQIIL